MNRAGGELRAFPNDILVDATKSKEAVFVHPDQSIYADASVAEAFKQLNDGYLADKEGRINFMDKSVGRISVPGTLGFPAGIKVAFEADKRDRDSNEVLLLTSPLNDGRPKSSAARMVRYLNTDEPSFMDIALTQPNSWGPLTKLDIGYEFIHASGRNIPVLQLFSRLPPRAMSLHERRLMWQGDYLGFGRIALQAVQHINKLRVEQGHKKIDTVHFFGAGMGQRALGAAAFFAQYQDEFDVGSVTVQNLGLRRGPGAATDHMTQSEINEPSRIIIPDGHVRIDEPAIRQDIDHRGSDTLSMYGRQARAIADLSYIKAFMFDYKPTLRDISTLVAADIPVRIVNALNTGMNINTLHYLPIGDRRLKFSSIVGIEGQKVGEMANEHAGIVAVSMALGIHDYHQALREARS